MTFDGGYNVMLEGAPSTGIAAYQKPEALYLPLFSDLLDFSLLQVNLETGRKHQIRVHMQEIGHPVVGDTKYGSKEKPIRRLALHAQRLVFTHPKTSELCSFETSIPEKFHQLFTRNQD